MSAEQDEPHTGLRAMVGLLLPYMVVALLRAPIPEQLRRAEFWLVMTSIAGGLLLCWPFMVQALDASRGRALPVIGSLLLGALQFLLVFLFSAMLWLLYGEPR